MPGGLVRKALKKEDKKHTLKLNQRKSTDFQQVSLIFSQNRTTEVNYWFDFD